MFRNLVYDKNMYTNFCPSSKKSVAMEMNGVGPPNDCVEQHKVI